MFPSAHICPAALIPRSSRRWQPPWHPAASRPSQSPSAAPNMTRAFSKNRWPPRSARIITRLPAAKAILPAPFRDVIRFTERPILRTAPAPLYQLSGLVREKGLKVVLTGEGADEVFAGYDIFKEARVRRFLRPPARFADQAAPVSQALCLSARPEAAIGRISRRLLRCR